MCQKGWLRVDLRNWTQSAFLQDPQVTHIPSEVWKVSRQHPDVTDQPAGKTCLLWEPYKASKSHKAIDDNWQVFITALDPRLSSVIRKYLCGGLSCPHLILSLRVVANMFVVGSRGPDGDHCYHTLGLARDYRIDRQCTHVLGEQCCVEAQRTG